MIPYDKIEKDCTYGTYNLDKHAGYTLTNGEALKGPWYYIYQNKKVLLYVDQNGPVKIQHEPPFGIMLIKREMGEVYSKWVVWVQSDSVNNGVPVCNFNNPKLAFDGKKPKFWADWTPEKAIYHAEYKNMEIVTELFVPQNQASVCMKTTIKNTGDMQYDYVVTPAVFPYCNIPIMKPWDLPEWYLASKVRLNGEKALSIHSQMTDPLRDPTVNRSVTFNLDYEAEAELDLYASNFAVSGSFYAPDALKTPDVPFTYKMKDVWDSASHSSFQQTFAARYRCTLKPNESKTYTQVFTIQNDRGYNAEEEKKEQIYFDEKRYNELVEERTAFFDEWFKKRSIKTENPLLDNFVNTFASLQMYWTGALDRGWPIRMRGTRDASQDFTGVTPLDPEWARSMLLHIVGHQRRDGWFPRAISMISREAENDMRNYCDGGAFFLEFVNEYLTFTRDTSVLFEKSWWLDSDEQSTVLDHIIQCVQFYIDEKNIGEHDLCKVWYGDWWDVMDEIGEEGIGETVTVTAQMIVNLSNMSKMIEAYKDIIPEKYHSLPATYRKYRERFIAAMRKTAFNKEGFFQGYMNDKHVWLGADAENDPEGKSKLYLVSNSWAVISGACTPEMSRSVLDKVEEMNLGPIGYYTLNPGYYTPVPYAGRVGLRGPNPGTYNHAQCFLVRACCTVGDSEMAYKASRYIFPFEQEYAPVEMTYAPPYAIANGYSNSKLSLHRVQFQFLSGTVSYTLRIFYNFFFGINYRYDGLALRPCLPKAFGDCSVSFMYIGKKFTVHYKQGENKSVKFNGKDWTKTVYDEEYQKDVIFMADNDMQDENVVEVVY